MIDYIIMAVLVIAVIAGIIYTVKHFRGQSSCCGGGTYKPKRKKLNNVKYTKTFKVEGMHCDACSIRVQETINDLRGISASVDLKKGILVVSYAEDVDDAVIISRVERVGFFAELQQ